MINKQLQVLLDTYKHKGEPIYISNNEILQFFIEHRKDIAYADFKEIRDYFLKELKVPRAVFARLAGWFKHTDKIPDARKIAAPEPAGISRFREVLKLKRYSEKTIKSYIGSLRCANNWFVSERGKTVENVYSDDARALFLVIINELELSPSLVRMYRFSLASYFNHILRRKLDLSFLDGVKGDRYLPTVLSRVEIAKLLDSITNVKHRTMIGLLYASGLRLSELVNLRVGDIQPDELLIHVHGGKGRKDRITILSKKILEGIYYCIDGKKADDYIFTSETGNRHGHKKHLSGRTVQKVLNAAIDRAGIKKKATPHDLRHSFATHLLENGISLRHIQMLLGHKNITTTSVYTKVTRPGIKGIQSPLQ